VTERPPQLNTEFCEDPVEMARACRLGSRLIGHRKTRADGSSDDTVAQSDRVTVADGCHFTRTVGKRHDAELRRDGDSNIEDIRSR